MKELNDRVGAVLANFNAYKSHTDTSEIVSPRNLYDRFTARDEKASPTPISTFATVVHCPYLAVNVGAGHRAKHSAGSIEKMGKGSVAHKLAEERIREEAISSRAIGGPVDLINAPKDVLEIRTQDLLQSPEVPVQLSIDELFLRGRADGLMRKNGVVIAVERKPKSAWYRPASKLQAMAYAIGGSLGMKSDQATTSASWMVTDYNGEVGPSGFITQNICTLLVDLATAYISLIRVGKNGVDVPGLWGPTSAKCNRCQYQTDCKYQAAASSRQTWTPK